MRGQPNLHVICPFDLKGQIYFKEVQTYEYNLHDLPKTDVHF